MIKKTIVTGLTLALLASGAGMARAETTSAEQLQMLLQQVKSLQEKLSVLKGQQSDIMKEIKDTVALARDLRQGMTSEEVKALQEILAADPEVYPEGIVSGFYGALTAKAVAKFQAKHGVSDAGGVGEKTRAKLNALARDKDFVCHAWGKLIAPGQIKKRLGNADIDLSNCGKIPPGIKDKLDTASTSASLSIKSILVDDIDAHEADISWKTNIRAKGMVWYSDDEDDLEGDLDDVEHQSAPSFDTMQTVDLFDLDEDTTYYYVIVATDKSGKTATSSVKDFETEGN